MSITAKRFLSVSKAFDNLLGEADRIDRQVLSQIIAQQPFEYTNCLK